MTKPSILQLNNYINNFHSYTKPYLELENYKQSVSIKIYHSLQVLKIAQIISSELPENLKFPLELAALFHDIGRFEQIKRYGTFVDRISCNHGILGVKVLKKQGYISHLPKDIQKIIYSAIILHNKFILPKNLPQDILAITNALRDADKVDILRVMVENYDNPSENSDMISLNVDESPNYSPKILNQLLNKEPILYSDLKYVNDFRLLQGGWLNDLNFKSSKQYIKEQGYMHSVLKGLPNTKEIQKAKEFILSTLDS